MYLWLVAAVVVNLSRCAASVVPAATLATLTIVHCVVASGVTTPQYFEPSVTTEDSLQIDGIPQFGERYDSLLPHTHDDFETRDVLYMDSLLDNSTQPLETARDVELLLYDIEQELKMNMTRQLIGQYRAAKLEAGVPQSQVAGVTSPAARPGNVSAIYPFAYAGDEYAVVAERTLSESYIARMEGGGAAPRLLRVANFSVHSFDDSQYTAAFRASLRQRVVQLRAHVHRDSVYIMCALEQSLTLLFLVSAPSQSWTPKYQDTVLSEDEFASDLAFFEELDQLRVLVAVGRRRVSGQTTLTPAHQSYIYALSGGIKWLQLHVVPTPQGASAVTTFVDQRWTYIVIGQDDVQSLVYRHSWDSQQLELFQYLPSQRALCVQAFRHAHQWYVLMVNGAGNGTLFWWSADQLFVWQTLHVPNHEVALFGRVGVFSDDEKFIYIVSQRSILFYTSFASYSGHFTLAYRHVFAAHYGSLQCAYAVRVPADSHYLLVSLGAGAEAHWITHRLNVTRQYVVPTPPEADPLHTCLATTRRALRLLNDGLDALLSLSQQLFISSLPATVTAPVTVTGQLQLPGGAHVQLLSVAAAGDAADSQQAQLDDLHQQLHESLVALSDIGGALRTVLTGSTSQVVSGQYGFSTLAVTGTLYLSSVTSLQTLGALPVTRLLTAALTVGGDQQLPWPLQLAAADVSQLTAQAGRINGVRADDLMLRRADVQQTITGLHHYRQLGVTGDLLLSRLNGLQLLQLLRRGQTLRVPAADVTAAPPRIRRLLIAALNGVPFAGWRAGALRLDAAHVFTEHVQLIGATCQRLHVRHLNGQLLTLVLGALWRRGSGVAGSLVFQSPLAVSQLQATTVNSLHLPSVVLTSDSEQVVSSHVQVETLSVFEHLLTGLVNQLDLTADVVSTAAAAGAALGQLRFTSALTVSAAVQLSAGVSINGVDVSSVAAQLLNSSALLFPAGATLRGRWRVTGAVSVATLHRHDVSALQQLFWTRSTEQRVPGSVSVSQSLHVTGALTVGTLAGVAPSHLLDVTVGGVLRREVVLTDATTTQLLMPAGRLVNNRSLAQFAATVVTRSGSQLIAGVKTLSSAVYTARIAAGSINGVDPVQLLLTDRAQLQTGSVRFVGDVEASGGLRAATNVSVTGTINGYAVAGLLDHFINVWPSHVVEHTLLVRGNARFSDLHVQHTLNGLDLDSLLAGLLSTREDRLLAALTIAGDVRLASQLQLASVNGLDWRRYLQSVILADVGGTVVGMTRLPATLRLPTSVLHVTQLNGFSAPLLLQQYLTRDSEQQIEHRVTVAGSVVVDRLQTALVNNVAIERLMFTDRPLEFHQAIHLFAPLQTAQLHVLSGQLGRCSLPAVWQYGLRRSAAAQTLLQHTELGQLSVSGDVTLAEGDVAAQLRRWLDRVVTVDGPGQLVTAPVTAALATAHSPHLVLYNGRRLSELYERAVLVDSAPLAVTGVITCSGGVTLRTVTATAEALVTTVNGVPLWPWLDRLLLPGGQQTTLRGALTLSAAGASHVISQQLVNGRPAAPWLELGQRVDADVYFDAGVRVQHQLSVGGLVDGVDIRHVLARAFRVLPGSVYNGNVTVTGDVVILGDVTTPNINDVELSDLVLNHQLNIRQTITSVKKFTRLHVQGDICGRLTGSPLSVPEQCSALLSSTASAHVQAFSGHLTFARVPAQLSGGLAQILQNVTAASLQLTQQKLNITRWMQPIRQNLTQLGALANQLAMHPELSIDLAYLLLVQRVLLPDAASMQTAPASTRTVHVLLRTRDQCALPGGCLCRRSARLRVHQGGLLVAEQPSTPGQLWQFHAPQLQLRVTVTSGTDSCAGGAGAGGRPPLTVATGPAGGAQAPEPVVGLVVGAVVSDVDVFSVGGRVLMAVGYSDSPSASAFPATQVLRRDAAGVWRVVQSLPAYGVQSLQTAELDGAVHLLVVNRHSRRPLSLQSEVQLFIWSRAETAFAEVSVLYHADVREAIFLRRGDGQLLVAVADLDGLTLLEYAGAQYRVCQYVAEPGVAALSAFPIGAETYLAVFSTKRNQLLVYLLTDQAGLQPHSSYPATAVRALTVFPWRRQLYLAAVRQNQLVVYCVVIRGRFQRAPITALPLLE